MTPAEIYVFIALPIIVLVGGLALAWYAGTRPVPGIRVRSYFDRRSPVAHRTYQPRGGEEHNKAQAAN